MTATPAARTIARPLPVAQASLVLGAAGAAWFFTVAVARGMGVMPGTMGLGFAGFFGTWALMMAAMMLPSIVPLTSLYARTLSDRRGPRTALLASGYLAVWAATAVVAYALAGGGGRLAERAPGWAQAVAITSCVACGIYQMTSLKDRCLQHCRSPLGHLMRYTSLHGRFVDVRVGLDHGAWCVACCWSLMVLLVTFGVMNVFAMVSLAAVILVEKVLAPGRWFSVTIGVVALALGVAIWVHPALAPGLHTSTMSPTMG